jgi:cell wall-associated NlpC family hydrolase
MTTPIAQARIAAAVAPLQREARVSAMQSSQLLAGHTIALLERQGDWWRVAGRDAYEGWMHTGYIEHRSDAEATWGVSLGATVSLDGVGHVALPVGARVAPNARIIEGKVVDAGAAPTMFPAIGSTVVQSAQAYFSGASYQWGGGTPWGCDCSGLVQSVFRLHGHELPRDAWQQAECGDALAVVSLRDAGAAELLEAGDLLFFSDRDDRHVTHVGIVATDFHMLHSGLARGGVRNEALRSRDDYVERLCRNFTSARRVLSRVV